jgi:hypothetical protein
LEIGNWKLEIGILDFEIGIWDLEIGIWDLEFGILEFWNFGNFPRPEKFSNNGNTTLAFAP